MPLVDLKSIQPSLYRPMGVTTLPGNEPGPEQEPDEGGGFASMAAMVGLVATPGPALGLGLGALLASPHARRVAAAGFEESGLIGSTMTSIYLGWGISNAPQAGYNPWDDIKGTPYEDYWHNFAESNNPRHTDYIKRKIDRERANERVLADAGWGGTVASIAGAMLDPTIFIPVGGQISLAGKGVWTLAKGAGRTALATGGAVAVQEAGLHATQELRTGTESAINIGSSVVLGGLLGSAASLLSRAEQRASSEALETLGINVDNAYVAMQAADAEDAAHATGMPTSAGAAATSPPTVADFTIMGNITNWVARTTRMVSPKLRANFRAAPEARQFMQVLTDTDTHQAMHVEGRSTGPSVVSEMRQTYTGRLIAATEAHNELFRAQKKAGAGMSREQFEEEIAYAMRRDDQGVNDFVSEASKAWRERLFDPLKDRAIQLGIFPSDVDITTALSYFSRVWDRPKMTAHEFEIKGIFTAHIEGELSNAHVESTARLQAELAKHDETIGDLALTPKKRAGRIEVLQAEADQLDAANAAHVDRISTVNDLRARAKEAEARGDAAEGRALRDEAKKAYSDGGDGLTKYLAKRRSLRSRRTRLTDTPSTAGARKSRIGKAGEKKAEAERAFNARWDGYTDPGGEGFTSHARQVADDIFDTLTGRNQTDSGSALPDWMTPITRGPLKGRTFNIPDVLVEKVLVNNVRTVAERYARTMAGEMELTAKFGRADMREQRKILEARYLKLREEVDRTVADPKLKAKKLKALDKDERDALRDQDGVRDIIRGTYYAAENASNFARVVRSLLSFNYIRQMGGIVPANLSDLYRPAMVHGLGSFMGDGIKPLLTNLDAYKLTIAESKLAGVGGERALQLRQMSMSEMGDPYRDGNTLERWIQNGARGASHLNGINYFTDFAKNLSSIVSQHEIIGMLRRYNPKDVEMLAYLGIDKDMAVRVARQLEANKEDLDGVLVAHTQEWDDDLAVRAFRAALGKDVQSTVVTPEAGDLPLFAYRPLGRLIFQFRTFNLAAHQKLMLRAMQEGNARLVSSMIGMTTVGMTVATIKAWRGGDTSWERFKGAASNPGYLIGEGLDNSGFFSLPMELGNIVEKITPKSGLKVNPIKTPLMLAGRLANPDASMQGASVRFVDRGVLSAVAGPSADIADTALKGLGVIGDPTSESRRKAAARMMPYNSYFGIKEVLQLLTGDSPYVEE